MTVWVLVCVYVCVCVCVCVCVLLESKSMAFHSSGKCSTIEQQA
jgi:preprotein translocase subunit SecG